MQATVAYESRSKRITSRQGDITSNPREDRSGNTPRPATGLTSKADCLCSSSRSWWATTDRTRFNHRQVKQELKGLVALAPLHLPSEIAVIEAASDAYPDVPQIACFDTAFHSRMPTVAKRLPLPRASLGRREFVATDFTVCPFEYIVSQLGKQLSWRSIIAHLGNGCSMVALKDGIPQDTTMGLTPTGGLMMGTRSGDLDPGVLFYLLRSCLHNRPATPIRQMEYILNDESGLFGVSGISRNMEDLLKAEPESISAKRGHRTLLLRARKFIGSLSAVLGGLDTLSSREESAKTRASCEDESVRA